MSDASEYQDAVNQIDAHRALGRRCTCDDCEAARWTLRRLAMLSSAVPTTVAEEAE